MASLFTAASASLADQVRKPSPWAGALCQPQSGGNPGHRTVSCRHAANLPFAPKQAVVVKLRNPVQMNRIDCNYAAFPQAAESRHHHIAAGRESHSAIQRDRRFVALLSNPGCAQ